MYQCKLVGKLVEEQRKLKVANPMFADAFSHALDILRDMHENGISEIALQSSHHILSAIFLATEMPYEKMLRESAVDCEICAAILAWLQRHGDQ